MSDRNKAVVRRLIEEGMNEGSEGTIDELVAPNFAAHEQEEMRMIGLDGFKELLGVYRTAFPDMKLTIDEIVAEGDKVVTWATFTGTHRGPLQSLPATGKPVKVKDVDMFRVQAGKVTEAWTHFDQWGLMKQLGVVPEGESEEG
jgi:steroid delta-isomerase-like uncharacterized protein